jgi:chorismate--pyruvate lyase
MAINWLTLSDARQQLSPTRYVHLADNGSLTRRVRQACKGRFEVSLIDHGTVQPSHQEYVLLNLPEASRALSRQVFLCCDQIPLIFARTIIGLVEKNRILTERIANLGEQSLGSVLFRDPLAVKRQMHLACLAPNHAFFRPLELQGFTLNQDVWLRRSLYNYEGCDLIVYEAFIGFTEPGKRLD